MSSMHTAAVVVFSNTKNCFLAVPESWHKDGLTHQDIRIFKLRCSNNQTAYFSCIRGDVLNSTVQLSGKYALTLGLKDGEEVMLSRVNNVPSAEKVILEPVDTDDWEIMSLNADVVENGLLNQIRVVWKDQVFPVWVHQSSLFVKVAEISPEIEVALLAEWTEVHITPKDRTRTKQRNKRSVDKPKKRDIYSQYKHLKKRTGKENKSNMSASFTSDSSESGSHGNVVSVGNTASSSTPSAPVFSLLRFVMKSVFTEDSSISPVPVDENLVDEFCPLDIDFHLRVISYSKGVGKKQESLPLALQATTAFISERTFAAHCDIRPVPQCFVAKLTKLLSPMEAAEQAQANEARAKAESRTKSDKGKSESIKDFRFDSVCVNIVVLKSAEEEFDVPEALFFSSDYISVPMELKRRLGLEITSRVRCQGVNDRPFAFNTILLYPLENLSVNFVDGSVGEAFAKWLEDADLEDSSLILCDGTLCRLPVSKNRTCDFTIVLSDSGFDSASPMSVCGSEPNSLSSTDGEASPPSSLAFSQKGPSYGFISEIKLKRIAVKLGAFSPHMRKLIWCHSSGSNKSSNLHQSIPAIGIEALGGVKEVFENVMQDINLGFKLRPLSRRVFGDAPSIQCILIHGPKGVGKSTFIKAVCKKLINYPHFIYIYSLNCLPLRGKRVETIAKKWEMAFEEALHRQPSLLILEDLDQLASAPLMPEQETGQDGHYFSSIAQVFIRLMKRVVVFRLKIVTIITAKSIHSLHPSLMRTGGQQMFQSVIEMEPPDVDQRSEILQSLVLSKLHLSADSIPSVLWTTVAVKTEGYVARDLDILVDKATHAALVRAKYSPDDNGDKKDKEVTVITSDFEVAMGSYTPASLQGLQLHTGSGKTWKNVGGLHHVKDEILRIITWPVKYKPLFKNYGLKPHTNILLYGEPGTGKTLIAGAIASECGINFISIKGPELLSKYVGASEKGVRDLFARASSAKPCIIFFDEFDALAPRRGHDSTGVTDRVVNQLLTQMDGVESVEGVYVLAATSRPELIDPALLRPGRLDKCLHCPLPDEKDRIEILQALSTKLSLAEDVDFKSIAQKTEHFSGADLQALLYSAQIEAIHDTGSRKTRKYSSGDVDSDCEKPIENVIVMPSVGEGAVDSSSDIAKTEIQRVNKLVSNMKSLSTSRKNNRRKHSIISTTIEQRHILSALSQMKPSVSEEERLRYSLIFSDFKEGRASGFSLPKGGGKRVTLA